MTRISHFMLLLIISFAFFWQVWLKGLLPIPTDALVGMYHPFRDYFVQDFPNGVAYKNPLLTDPVLQQYPWKWLVMDYWTQGRIPLVNPYNFSGAPLIANIQAGAFYPLNVIFLLVKSFPQAWTIFIVSQPVLTAAFMYLYLTSKSLPKLPAVFGGVVWAFSSFNMVWLEWGNIGHAGLYLPLALLAVDKLKAHHKSKFPWIVILSLVMGMSLLAGHAQVTLYLMIAAGLYALMNRKLFSFLISTSLFLVLTAFQWYPALLFSLQSNRSVEQLDVIGREGFFIHPKHLVQLAVPDYFGNPATLNYRGEWNYAEQIVYIGLAPLALAIIAFLLSKEKQLVTYSSMLVLFGLAFAVRNPVAQLPYIWRVPLLADLQPTRLSYLVTFGLSALSALGLQQLLLAPKKSAKLLVSIVAVGASILFALLIISSKFEVLDKLVSQRNLILPAMFLALVISSGAALALSPRRTWLRPVTYFLLLISTVDLFRFGWKFTPFSPPSYLYPVTPAISFLQDRMQENDRYMSVDRRILPPNANIIYRLKSIEGYDPIYSKAYARLVTAMETGEVGAAPASFGRIVRPGNYRSPVAAQLSVRYVLALSDLDDSTLAKVFQEGETRIYEVVSQDTATD